MSEQPPVAPEAPVRTAYLTSRYPAESHTFVLREVQGVRAQGVDVATWTVRRSDPAQMRTETMRREDANTEAILEGSKRRVLDAGLRFARRNPVAFAGGLSRALRSGYPSAKARLWQLFYYAEALYLHERLEAEGIQHIHAHHINVAADVARLAVDLGNRIDGEGTWTWSFTIHGQTEFDNVDEHDMSAKAHDADAISAISYYAQSQIWRQMDPADWGKVSIQRMTVDPEVFRPRADRGEHEGPLRLVTVGRLHPMKGYSILVDVIDMLRERGVDVELRLVGGGPLEGALTAQIARLGLEDRITMLGALGEDGVVEQMQWADVFVSSSFAEGLPVVLMEAMSAEVVPVATRLAAIEELVVDGVNGLVVPPSNATALADAIEELAADPGRRREMGRKGREAVLAEFTQRTVGPRMARFFRDVTAGA